MFVRASAYQHRKQNQKKIEFKYILFFVFCFGWLDCMEVLIIRIIII